VDWKDIKSVEEILTEPPGIDRFCANEVRLWLSVIVYNLGNLRRLALPVPIGKWSLTSLQRGW
jgi:hypothetical protein